MGGNVHIHVIGYKSLNIINFVFHLNVILCLW